MAATERLILQVDAAVELAKSNLRALANSVEADSKHIDGSLRRVDAAHTRMATSLGNVRASQQELMHVTRAMSDGFAAGIPIQQLFFSELGRIAEAASNAGGSLGTLGRFLGGPWGIAVSAATAILGTLIFSHKDAAAGATKHKDAEKSLEEAIHDMNVEAKKAIETSQQQERQAYENAQALLAQEVQTRKATKALLESAVAQEAIDRQRSQGPGQRGELGTLAAGESNGRSTALQTRVDAESAAIIEAQQALRLLSIPIEQRRVEERRDPATRAAGLMERQEHDLNIERQHGLVTLDQYDQRLKKIKDTYDATIDRIHAVSAAQKELDRDNHQSGRQVTLAEAESIVRSIGGTITSAQRSTALQAQLYANYKAGTGPLAAPPGHSLHESGQALDIAKTPGMSLGRIREAFRARGVNPSELLDEGNHFHVGFGKKGASQDSLARRAEAAHQKEIRDDETFAQDKLRAQEGLIKAQRELNTSISAQADFAVEDVKLEQARKDSAAQAAVAEHRLTQAEANQLKALDSQTAQQQIANIRAKEHDQIANEGLAIQQAGLRTEVQEEQLRAGLAITNKARRDSALKLLDLSQEQERIELQNVVDSKTATEAQRQIALARLGELDRIKSLSVQGINQQYAGAGQRFLSDLNSRDINQQLEEVKVDGLNSLQDGLVGVISGTKSVASAFHDMATQIIADLARIAIQKEIIEPLANALFGGGKSGSGGGIFSALSHLFGGGGGSPATTLTPAGGVPLSFPALPKFADGGFPTVGMPSLVGERGPEIIIPTSPSMVIPNHMIGRAGPNSIVVNVNAQGAVLTQQVRQWVAEGVQAATFQGAAIGSGDAQAAMYRRASRQLR